MDRATRMMISEFGADCLIAKKPMAVLPMMTRQIERNRVNRRLTAEYDFTQMYDFPDDGVAARVTVVWGQYFPRKHEARAYVRRALGLHHIDGADVAHVWACPYERHTPPLRADMTSWRSHTMKGIYAANAEHVVLLGGAATSLWWQDAKMTRVGGNPYVWGSYYVYPIMNPLALHHDLEFKDWISSWGAVARGVHEGGSLRSLDIVCHAPGCGALGVVYDQRAVAWCDKHFNISKAERQDKKWEQQSNKQNQQTLV